jgi:putative membrane protein insertion efficiency factor
MCEKDCNLDQSSGESPGGVCEEVALKRASVLGALLIGLVRIYQLVISPWLGKNCRYVPSCSQYMILSVQKYGVFRGGFKGLRRILRCHPLHPGGYDPP